MGKGVRIKDVGTVVENLTPPSITRKNRERLITVSGVVADGKALNFLKALLTTGTFTHQKTVTLNQFLIQDTLQLLSQLPKKTMTTTFNQANLRQEPTALLTKINLAYTCNAIGSIHA